MIKKIFTYYKLPLLISATLGIIVAAMGVVKKPLEIIEIISGVLMGTFILDVEYILYSYMFEPNSNFAVSVFGYIKSKDIGGLIAFINEHRDDIKEKSLNSALFQIILAPIVLFVSYSTKSYFAKTFVLSMFAISIYRLIECYFEGDIKEWFWALKVTPKKSSILLFIIVLLAILASCLFLI
jgi:hypothetical protein